MALTGTVKSFNAHKGWGFIEANGQDVFLNKKDLKGFLVEKGTQVQFTTTTGPKGLQAQDCTVIVSPEQATYFGEIKSFNEAKGFGFITCEAFPGQDVFVLRTELQGGFAPQGGHCKFKVTMQEKGANAKDVQLLGAAGNQLQAMKQMGGPMQAMMGGKGMGGMMGMMGMKGMGGMGMGGMPMGMGVMKHMFMKNQGGDPNGNKALKNVDDSLKVWIGQLAPGVNWKALQEHMNKAGKTKWIEVFGGKGKGTGAAVYGTQAEAANAITMLNGSVLGGQSIQVDSWVKSPKA
eukprot:TRINITY_DN6151_c0_g1_i2.p2 TRINITY_DN6151_c0_g1~~TRINITY_DN6151_c0_g1_i2.p2  ORF type:complete len:291 (-),score=95.95 TRINITY_DN6151_c0_g1_i2:244-1116(-)